MNAIRYAQKPHFTPFETPLENGYNLKLISFDTIFFDFYVIFISALISRDVAEGKN